ncbi:MAG: ferrochelatase [Magnetococcales bacterium]|nr:ferrochelatase [Magnetococcales bacterium]
MTTAVVLVQLGTPDEPTPSAVKRYLRQFLSDQRVVDLPRWLWQPLLHGLILPLRSPRSAALYHHIWREDGLSPLYYYTRRQAEAVAHDLEPTVTVRYAMRYGQPALSTVLDELQDSGCDRLLIFPLFAHYSGATHASIVDNVYQTISSRRALPTLRFAAPFFEDPLYLRALVQRVEALASSVRQLRDHFFLFSFHGLPQSHIDQGDPYQQQCQITVTKLATALSLPTEQWAIAFQSRFGRQKWLQPATDQQLKSLPQQGHKQVVVICPGFVSDCLETLEELGQQGRQLFLDHGGTSFQLLPCLNDSGAWLEALTGLVRQELSGWGP